MKKFLAFILALACALSLMACGKKNNDDKPDPTPAPDPQPTVITAEFTHGYVDMKLDLPEGWSWEQVSDNGTDKTEGIRFYKTDDPTVSYTLLCWTGGYGICGTGVTSEEITLANGMKVWQHTEENTEKGTMVMADIFFEDVPGSYVASPSETMTTEVWNANRDALLSILGTAQIGRKSVSQQAAIDAAKAKIEANTLKIAEMERTRGENQQRIAAAEETIRSANAARMEKEAAIAKLGQDNRALTDERERMSGEMARLAERRTAAETELNDTNSKLWEEYQLTESEARSQCVPFESLTELRRSVTEVRGKIRGLGNVNVGAIEEYKEVKERYDFLKAQVTDVEKAKSELTKMIAELCSEMEELFTTSFKQINTHFQQIFRELFGGGHARLYLSDEANVLESGIEIEVSPPGKVIKNLSALSGGEQALVAISIYFAILNVNPAPFCFLDEIEAALDDVNVARYAQYLRRMTDHTQFIVITHRRGTMEAADVLYGVTMQEDGVSKILRLDLDNVSADLIT